MSTSWAPRVKDHQVRVRQGREWKSYEYLDLDVVLRFRRRPSIVLGVFLETLSKLFVSTDYRGSVLGIIRSKLFQIYYGEYTLINFTVNMSFLPN